MPGFAVTARTTGIRFAHPCGARFAEDGAANIRRAVFCESPRSSWPFFVGFVAPPA